ncbi:unnamed protein product [Clonostachys rhizophaga]|uniref:Uncharacterized protein n=1 Tax=Clonostachys rhizophaga TaxID=160324 RepID=A0A9N9YNM9_9HYPO|nr:unnamed protein product [Clonostachys rhizophaga]
MVTRSFQVIDNVMFKPQLYQQYTLPSAWTFWENAYLYRMTSILDNPRIPAKLISSGCQTENMGRNCSAACGNLTSLFGSPETLWNCVTISTVAMMTTNGGPDTLDQHGEDIALNDFHSGSLDKFVDVGVFRNYRECALRSCSDSRFGGCPLKLPKFQCGFVTKDTIGELAKLMRYQYCKSADPGIDYDIAGPGIIISYFIQFILVVLFTLSFKFTTSWLKRTIGIILAPVYGVPLASKEASRRQEAASESQLAESISSSLIDLQETQALFLITVAAASVITFTGENGTGLGNIQSLLSWLSNSIVLRGMVVAGSYSLLLTQLILHRAGKRWWYTLLLIIINLVFVIVLAQPQRVRLDTLIAHFQDTVGLASCGGNPGPMTFCQTLNRATDNPAPAADSVDPISSPTLFFDFNSRYPQPLYVVSVLLVLDWIVDISRQEVSKRSARCLPPTILHLLTSKRLIKLWQVYWAILELFTFVMCLVSIWEFFRFLGFLRRPDGNIDPEEPSDVNITKWSFGQLIAVAVWFPVIFKFISINISK